MNIPKQAIKYILYQRTQYLRFPLAPVYRFLNRLLPFETPLVNMVVAAESQLWPGRVRRLYAADMRGEYETLKAHLPPHCSAVLDIGCGVAGVDVLLQQHYQGQPIDFYLLDKSKVERQIFYLFRQRAAFYNSLEVSRATLVLNGVDERRVHLVEANEQASIGVEGQVDLIISLLSWGFHYPVSTYVRPARELLREKGVLILDVRRETGGVEELRRHFPHVEVVHEEPKYQRVLARP